MKKIVGIFVLVILLMTLCSCGLSTFIKNGLGANKDVIDTIVNKDVIDTIDEITDEQLICDNNGIKIWMMNLSIDNSYDEPFWIAKCYMENNSGHEIDVQLNNIAVNGEYTADFRGVNNESNLLDGQKGTFIIELPASDLDFYGITEIKSMSGTTWVFDVNSFQSIVNHVPFDVSVDSVGNIHKN